MLMKQSFLEYFAPRRDQGDFTVSKDSFSYKLLIIYMNSYKNISSLAFISYTE